MPNPLTDETLRRLMVAKHLLASNLGQLAPHSDPTAVARMILAAHDSADLALAAIANHLEVPYLREPVYLMDYPAKIAEKTTIPFPGTDFLKRLNAARVGFKHYGNLPDARSWYRVIENTWSWMDEWCRAYMDVPLENIDLEELLADPAVKDYYRLAKEAYEGNKYAESLEYLGLGMFEVARALPGVDWPVVGSMSKSKKNTEAALMLTAFGVRPSDYLGLQDFLPRVTWDFTTSPSGPKLEWDRRGKGHEGNWSESNVRFCLETFLDLALKVQHAPQVPFALQYASVFEDVITPKGDHANLFEYVYDGKTILTMSVVGRTVVRTLHAGEELRCQISPSQVQEKPREILGLASLGVPDPTVETSEVLAVAIPGEGEDGGSKSLYVDKQAVHLSSIPRDDLFIRRACPHLFRE